MSATISTPGTRRCRRTLLGALPPVVCAAIIAACGSSGQQPGSAAHTRSLLAVSECMRRHGVTNFPDPDPRGGLNLNGTGINPFSPDFKAAQSICNKLLPGGAPSGHVSEQQEQQLVAVSECMRRHGVSGFPDPTTRSPTSLQSLRNDYSLAESIGGNLFLLVPKTINVNSPAFRRAARACSFNRS